jgi:hypothetical protein
MLCGIYDDVREQFGTGRSIVVSALLLDACCEVKNVCRYPGLLFSKELLVEDKEFVDTTGTVVAS